MGDRHPLSELPDTLEESTRTAEEEAFRAKVVELLELVGEEKAAKRYAECRDTWKGKVEFCAESPGHHAKYVPCSCMLRICPECSRLLGAALKERYALRLAEALRENAWRNWSAKLVTLTSDLELGADVGQAARDLLDNARDLYRALWGRYEGAGAFCSLEFGERGQKAHVHMVVVGCYIQQHVIADEWERLTGFRVVDVRMIRNPKRGLKEVLKYASKFSGLSPGQLVDLHMALKGRRRIRAWGVMFGHRCPHCAQRIPSDAIVCKHCRADLTVEHHCPVCEGQLARMSTWEWKRMREKVGDERLPYAMRQWACLLQSILANKFPENKPPPLQEDTLGALQMSGIAFQGALSGHQFQMIPTGEA